MEEQRGDRQRRLFQPVRLQQTREMHRKYLAQISWWRRPLVGYLVAIPLVGLGFLVLIPLQGLLPEPYFPDAALFLMVLLVSLFWGVGPALWTVLLSTLVIDYLYVAPLKEFSVTSMDGLLQLLPFVVFGLLIAIITGQRESARQRALLAEQVAKEQAEELARKNEELEHADQLKDRFISIASHELKTPITAIRGQAQLSLRRLKKQRELPPELQDVQTTLERVEDQTRRLNVLVEDLLVLSSLRSGKLALRMDNFDLVALGRSIIEDQHLLSEREITLDAPSKLVLYGDSDRLSQVMINLISNAIKYSSPESVVQVSVSALGKGKLAHIAVHNEGPAIPQEQQAHIFDTFYRTPDAQTSEKSGWGLGLAISKDIVDRHSGRIWCESAEGQGTTFFVELPIK